jgi:hypothetical protein
MFPLVLACFSGAQVCRVLLGAARNIVSTLFVQQDLVAFPVTAPGVFILHLRNPSDLDSVSPPVPDGDSGVRASKFLLDPLPPPPSG